MESIFSKNTAGNQGKAPAVRMSSDVSNIREASEAGPSLQHLSQSEANAAAAAAARESAMQRRSSSRNIKRKKFDDELVESSISSIKGQRARQVSFSSPSAVSSTSSTPLPIPITSVAPVTLESVTSVGKSNIKAPVSSRTSAAARKKRHRTAHLTAVENLGRWKPQDDLKLILAVQQTNDLDTVFRGVKFSCKFRRNEVEERWYALLYDQNVSKISVAAMRQLHANQVADIHANALYSKAEEDLLKSIPSTTPRQTDVFENLLKSHPDVFLSYRTPKILMNHWTLLKHHHLLTDQSEALARNINRDQLNFDEMEELVDREIAQQLQSGTFSVPSNDDPSQKEIVAGTRKLNREIRKLENEIPKWQVLMDCITGVAPSDFDNQTLAVLRGRLVRYLMRSREIILGRCTNDTLVDVDLSLEGPAPKISRKQALIRLHSTGQFIVSNTGKRPLYVDSQPVLSQGSSKLNNNSVLEIAGLKFVFLINLDLIAQFKTESQLRL